MLEMFDLTGKKAVVTGASGGLGKSMAEALAEAGAEAVLMGVSAKSLKAAEDFKARGLKAHGLSCDLSKPAEVKKYERQPERLSLTVRNFFVQCQNIHFFHFPWVSPITHFSILRETLNNLPRADTEDI